MLHACGMEMALSRRADPSQLRAGFEKKGLRQPTICAKFPGDAPAGLSLLLERNSAWRFARRCVRMNASSTWL